MPDAAGFVDRLPVSGKGPRVAVKDMIAVDGALWTAGLATHRTRRAERDADAVARLRAAGYLVAGTTMSDCAGFGTMTAEVINPRFAGRAVGGSSGGAAAAVAAGEATLGLGTDTGGSVRIPAAYCGLWALKASHGRLPMGGVLPLAPSFDVLGLLADDPAALCDGAAALYGEAVPAEAPPPALGIDGDALRAADAAILAPFERLVARWGVKQVVDPVVPYLTAALAHSAVVSAEALATYRGDAALAAGDFGRDIIEALRQASRMGPNEIAAARAHAARIGESVRQAMDTAGVDIMLAPTLPMPPAERTATVAHVRGERHPITNANIRLTFMANLAGLPVVVAPMGDISLQFIGRAGADLSLLRRAIALATGGP